MPDVINHPKLAAKVVMVISIPCIAGFVSSEAALANESDPTAIEQPIKLVEGASADGTINADNSRSDNNAAGQAPASTGRSTQNAAKNGKSRVPLFKKLWQISDAEPMISTDRNSVTPHPNSVPLGALQLESGMTLDKFHRGGDFIAGEVNCRLGTWPMGELRLQAPNYLRSFGFDGRVEGTTDILVGIKQEIEPHFMRKRGFDFGIIAGTSVPTGSRRLSTRRLDPFVQVIGFQKMFKHYTLGTSQSIFMPSEALVSEETGAITRNRNITYQPTVILFRHLGNRIDIWGEYAGQFFERGLSNQIVDFGGVWRPRKRHQVDFRFGFGLTNASPRAFIGMGYSVLVGKVLPWGRPL